MLKLTDWYCVDRDVLIRNFPQMAKGFGRVEEAIAFTEEKAQQWNDRKRFVMGSGSRIPRNKLDRSW
jgi:hypothetical protein